MALVMESLEGEGAPDVGTEEWMMEVGVPWDE